MVTSTRLKCSTHDVFLVLRVKLVMLASGCNRVEYWECPWPDCGYVRANKHQKKPVRRRGPKVQVALKTAGRAKNCRTQPADDRQQSFSF